MSAPAFKQKRQSAGRTEAAVAQSGFESAPLGPVPKSISFVWWKRVLGVRPSSQVGQ